jgi:hypothetical protein
MLILFVALGVIACLALAPGPGDTSAWRVRCDPALDRASEIAVADIQACKSDAAFVPDAERHYDGIWLTDSVFVADAYRYFGDDCRERLHKLVTKFAAAQEQDGNIPMVFWGREGVPDFGGRYDLAQNRKQNRDMESAYIFTHACFLLWKDFGDAAFVGRQLDAVDRSLRSLRPREDPATGLILATYGPPNSDVCADYAAPRTTAHVYFNVLYVQAYREAAEMAAARGQTAAARAYRAKGQALRRAINRFLWSEERGRYEPRIVRTPVTTAEALPAYALQSDTRFPVVDNMMALYYAIPDSRARVERVIRSIEACERGLKVWGRMVYPPYPDGFFTKEGLFNGGNYHNGDVWTWFSNRYPIALFRLGYPDRALDLMRRQAEVALRDGGFAEYYEDDAVGARKGAFHYAGTAASCLQAIVEGLFGLQLHGAGRRLEVAVSLRRSGEIACRLGTHPFSLRLEADARKGLRRLVVTTPFRGAVRFRLLVPPGTEAQSVHRDDGARLPARIERIGEGCYLHFRDRLSGEGRVYTLPDARN